LDELVEHYIARERDQAIVNLSRALDVARARIEGDTGGGRLYPTPYPNVARWRFRWIKVHRYWFAYAVGEDRLIITNVLHDTANIPQRVEAEDEEAPFQP
jgi:plasmid stabilization system protein ParE